MRRSGKQRGERFVRERQRDASTLGGLFADTNGAAERALRSNRPLRDESDDSRELEVASHADGPQGVLSAAGAPAAELRTAGEAICLADDRHALTDEQNGPTIHPDLSGN